MGAIAFDRLRFGTHEKAEFVQDCVSLTRPITSRQGLYGLYIFMGWEQIYLPSLGRKLSFLLMLLSAMELSQAGSWEGLPTAPSGEVLGLHRLLRLSPVSLSFPAALLKAQ